MLYLEPVKIYALWTKLNMTEGIVYDFFGQMKGMNDVEGWNHQLLFTISLLKIV